MSNKPWSYTKELNATIDEIDERLKPMTNTQTEKYNWGPLPQITDLYPNYPHMEHNAAYQAWATPTPVPPSPKPSLTKLIILILALVSCILSLIGSLALNIYIFYSIFTKPFNLGELTSLVILSVSHSLCTYLTYSSSRKLHSGSSI